MIGLGIFLDLGRLWRPSLMQNYHMQESATVIVAKTVGLGALGDVCGMVQHPLHLSNQMQPRVVSLEHYGMVCRPWGSVISRRCVCVRIVLSK